MKAEPSVPLSRSRRLYALALLSLWVWPLGSGRLWALAGALSALSSGWGSGLYIVTFKVTREVRAYFIQLIFDSNKTIYIYGSSINVLIGRDF